MMCTSLNASSGRVASHASFRFGGGLGRCGALWVLSGLPWQADRTQVGEGVVHQLQPLHADEATEDPKEVVPLEWISEVLVGQIQLLGGESI